MSQDHYEQLADQYESLEETPLAHVGREMVQIALGDCRGKLILDLGGGSGLRAREAIDLGAARVDNVDLSRAMLNRCNAIEERMGRKSEGRLLCYEANCFQSLDHLPLARGENGEGMYDIVMVIWTFDHASTVAELETGWRNVARYCRSGGKVISLGISNPLKQSPNASKYGVELSNIEAVEGGAKFTYSPKTSLPFSCNVEAIEAHYDIDRTRAIAKKMGIPKLDEISPAETAVVKKDEQFWQDFVELPSFYCVVGTKSDS